MQCDERVRLELIKTRMPEFKVEIFPTIQQGIRIENWMNSMRRGGYFVRTESTVTLEGGRVMIMIFRYIPSKNSPENISQPEGYKEPEINLEDDHDAS